MSATRPRAASALAGSRPERPPSGSIVRSPVACSTRSTLISASVFAEVVRADVQGRGEQAGGGERRLVRGVAEQRDAEARRARSRRARRWSSRGSVEVVLGERVDDAGQRRDRAEDQQRVAAPDGQRPEDRRTRSATARRSRRTARPTARRPPAGARTRSRRAARPGAGSRRPSWRSRRGTARTARRACRPAARRAPTPRARSCGCVRRAAPNAASSAAPPIFASPPVR